MKKIIVLILISTGTLYGESFYDYFQLKIGNKFFYNYVKTYSSIEPSNNCIDNYRMRIVITDTVNYSGKCYFHYTKDVVLTYHSGSSGCGFNPHMFPFNMSNYNAIRIDTLTGNIFYYTPGQGCSYSPDEIMIDSLNSGLGDTVRMSCGSLTNYYTCIDTNNVRKYYFYLYNVVTVKASRQYTKGVGLLSNCYYSAANYYSSRDTTYLTGHVINGIVYGDTSFTFVRLNTQNSDFPNEFVLYQNYPNPFNPSTTIRFDIPKSSHIKLIIYDMLGKEVEQLVNEELNHGSYETEWNGINYPSGVYFYKIITNDYTESKKMILLK